MSERPRVPIVITGHVDHGKSTIVGRLLELTGSLPKGKLELVQAICIKEGRPFEPAFLLDALKDEQALGKTIEAARVHFATKKRDFVIVDAPGHAELLRNMVTGAARAEAALLVVDAAEGLKESTRRHALMLSLLGVRRLAVLVNKMDLVDWKESRFRSLAREVEGLLAKVGARAEHYIPVSARHGDNLAERSKRMAWHKGPTALAALDGFPAPSPLSRRPLRLPVQAVYENAVAGTVLSGRLAAGDAVVFSPSGRTGVVRRLEDYPRPRRLPLGPGDAGAFTLKASRPVLRGEVVSRREEAAPLVGTRFEAGVFWLGQAPLRPGRRYHLKLGTAKVAVRVEKIHEATDAATLASRKDPGSVGANEAARCRLKTAKPVAFDLAGDNEALSRFVLVDGYEISGGGTIREALP